MFGTTGVLRRGSDWYPEIEAAINTANIAILLISATFLTSPFIRREEIPRLLKLRTEGGLQVIPLIIWPCAWQRVSWLKGIQGRPKDGRPLAMGSEYEIRADLAELVKEIDDLLQAVRQGPGSSLPVMETESHDFRAQLGAAHNSGLLTVTERLERIIPEVNPYVTGSSLEANSPVSFGRA